jgi:hypothetical protein
MSLLPHYTVLDTVFFSTDETLLKKRELFKDLSDCINKLIVEDFERLVSILYRLDINEKKLEYLLAHNNNENASDTIAGLILERQLQKIKSRQEHRRDKHDINEEDAW